MQEVCYLFTLYIPASLSRRTHEGPVPLHEAKIPPAKPPQPQRRQANATTPHYSVHMYIMLALWIHHQTKCYLDTLQGIIGLQQGFAQ